MSSLIYRPARYSKQYQWSPVLGLHQEVNRLFEDFWGENSESQAGTAQTWSPAVDVVEDKEHFLVTLEMAGVAKEDIRIETLNNQLVIAGERKADERRMEKGLTYSERKFGKFQRTFTLPTGLNTDKIEADYKDGVLHVFIPKSEVERPRQVKIGSGNSTGFFSKLIGKEKSEPATLESNKDTH